MIPVLLLGIAVGLLLSRFSSWAPRLERSLSADWPLWSDRAERSRVRLVRAPFDQDRAAMAAEQKGRP